MWKSGWLHNDQFNGSPIHQTQSNTGPAQPSLRTKWVSNVSIDPVTRPQPLISVSNQPTNQPTMELYQLTADVQSFNWI